MKVALVLLIPLLALAQEQTGAVAGSIVDSVSRSPIRNAEITLTYVGPPAQSTGAPTAGDRPGRAMTNAGGGFSFPGLTPGRYHVMAAHPRYLMNRRAGNGIVVEVQAGQTVPVTLDLQPGASVSGRFLDPDGDPLVGCSVQLRPLGDPARGAGQGAELSDEDGEYRVWGIEAGRFLVRGTCGEPVFEPRPLSAGPPPPPSQVYKGQFYPNSEDRKGAQPLVLAAGEEKSGIDFRMTPSRVYTVRGMLNYLDPATRSQNVNVMLQPEEETEFIDGYAPQVDVAKNTFEFSRVLPGRYVLGAAVQDGPAGGRAAGRRIVEVVDETVQADITLGPAVDIAGMVEYEEEPKTNPPRFAVQLVPAGRVYVPAPQPGQVGEDGSFLLKSVVPGLWRVQVFASGVYLKSVSVGGREVGADEMLDTTAGVSGPMRVRLGTRTGSIRATGKPGQTVRVVRMDSSMGMAMSIGPNGQLGIPNLAPGKYRLVVEDGGSEEEAPAKEVTVGEGEEVSVELD